MRNYRLMTNGKFWRIQEEHKIGHFNKHNQREFHSMWTFLEPAYSNKVDGMNALYKLKMVEETYNGPWEEVET